jgi:isopenicillin-N N-acyltransferase-like protein
MSSFLALEGDPYDIGYEHGSNLKNAVIDNVGLLHRLIRQYNPQTDNDLASHVERYLPFAHDYADDIVSEIRGIADATHLAFEEVFALNSINEVTYSGLRPGCTSFAIPPNNSKDGKVLIGQNQDWWIPFTKNFVTLKIRKKNGNVILMTTPAGFVGYVGHNSKGVGVQANALVSSDIRAGVPVPFVTRMILEQECIGEALDCVTSARRASPQNYIVADRHGEVYDIETTATMHELFYVEEPYAHANHFTSHRLNEKAIKWIDTDSQVRANRLNRLLRHRRESITVEFVQTVLKDHVNYPSSICRHPDPKIPEERWQDNWETSRSIISDIRNGRSWVSSGNPCKEPYLEIAV